MSLTRSLRFSEGEERLRAGLHAWLAENQPEPLPDDYEARVAALVRWQAKLAAAGFMGLSWPERYGGKGLGIPAEAVLASELASIAAPELINRVALYTVAPTLFDWGTEEQRRRFLPGMLDASELWCQGFSEPGAGSDLAAVQTTGRFHADGLVITGQKVWTSRADLASWCAALVRTDPDSARHRGLTFVIVPMRLPGVTVRPLLELNHHPHFSEVFFDSVQVAQENIVGRPGEGWQVAMSMLGYERGIFTLERQIRLQNRLAQLLRRLEADNRQVDEAAIGRLYSTLAVLEAQVYQTLAVQAAGELRPGQTAVDKLLLADADQRLSAGAIELLGEEVALEANDWNHALLTSRSVSIYGGTSEIQRNIVARQLLDLPGRS